MNNENQSSIWSKILKIVITVLTAVATTLVYRPVIECLMYDV